MLCEILSHILFIMLLKYFTYNFIKVLIVVHFFLVNSEICWFFCACFTILYAINIITIHNLRNCDILNWWNSYWFWHMLYALMTTLCYMFLLYYVLLFTININLFFSLIIDLCKNKFYASFVLWFLDIAVRCYLLI